MTILAVHNDRQSLDILAGILKEQHSVIGKMR